MTYFRSIIFWFSTSSFLFPHNVVSTATHRRIRLLETRKIIFWKMQTKCDLRKHSFTLCSILNAGRYHKMGPKYRNLEKNAGRLKWKKLEKTENHVFSIDNFLIFHVELFFPHNVVGTATHRRTRLLQTRKIIFWKMQTKCNLRKHFLPSDPL